MVPQPSDAHRFVQEAVGTWKVACTYYMDPTQPPMECEATDTIEAVGPFWTVSRFVCPLPDNNELVGKATLGYDPNKGKYVGFWIDSCTTTPFYYEGDYDADSKTLAMSGSGYFPMFQAECPYRMTNRENDDGTRTFEMFVTMPGAPEMKLFTYVYSRA